MRMITGTQIRAARALIGWNSTELAANAGLSYATIQRAESVEAVPRIQANNLSAISQALESAGVVFVGSDNQGGPGVRLTRGS